MPLPFTVNVITPDFEYGLAQSGRIVADVLNEAGFRARFLHLDNGRVSRLRQWCYRSWLGKFLRRDVNIFIEQLSPRFFNMARRQVLIPNQEWLRDKDRPYLRDLDLVICKSRHAEEIFSKMGCRTAYSSFTSRDRRLPNAGAKDRAFFLMAGNRPFIAERVLALWSRHPEWPKLTVSSRNVPAEVNLPNVHLMREFVSAEEITVLQNSHLFSVCITAAEGFGHKLNEAMACGSVVITTDGFPMNELIRPDRGFLVKWVASAPKALGVQYEFDEADLERTIERCLQATPEELARMVENGRRWFEENDRFFRGEFPEIVRKVAGR